MPQANSSSKDVLSNELCLEELMSEFIAKFPTEEDCLEELYRIARIEIKCHFCFSHDLQMFANRRAGKCSDCNKETWLTAGTILDHVKKPMARLAAIWLMSKGAVLKSTTFSKLANIVQSSAHEVLKWARILIEPNLPAECQLAHSSLFSKVFCKRSLLTPANAHPRSEQTEIEKLTDSIEPGVQLDCNEASAEEKHILSMFDSQPIHTDALIEKSDLSIGRVLSTLTILELNGRLNRLPGGYYIRCNRPSNLTIDIELSKNVEFFIDYILSNYGGISRRYLQSYLAGFWYYLLARSLQQESSLTECFEKLSIRQLNPKLRSYMTPLLVKIPT